MNLQPRVLFLLHLPPPIHGSSIVGMNIKESVLINQEFKCKFINLLASTHVAESGKISFKKIFGFIFTFVEVFISIIKKRPQLCYLALTSTGAAFYKDFLLVVLLKLFRIRVVFHLHNKGINFYQNRFINRLIYHYIFDNVDVIILSKHLYPDIQRFVSRSRVYICPNGTKDECNSTIDNIILKKDTIKFSPIRILFLSNLIESKGLFILLEALALLKQKEIEFECVFVGGEGEITLSKFNEQKYRLGLDDFVAYQGKKYGEEKKQAFLDADILVLPTYYSKECFPLVLLEAMSYSLPVVSTFEGGIPDIVDDCITGFLVKQKQVDSLAEKLELLINDPYLRLQMGMAGRNKYNQQFTLEKFEETLTGILQKIINK